MNKEEILYNEIYERTKDFGRTHFIKEIMRLQREYQQLKEINEEHKKLNGELRVENKKYKEVIDKIDKYINDYNVFEVFSFPLMERWKEEQVKSSIDYEFKTSLIKDLKDILKEVE